MDEASGNTEVPFTEMKKNVDQSLSFLGKHISTISFLLKTALCLTIFDEYSLKDHSVLDSLYFFLMTSFLTKSLPNSMLPNFSDTTFSNFL